MSRFFYTAYLPSNKKSVKLTELAFSDFKQLVKNILNDNNEIIGDAFEEVIRKCCSDDIKEITFLDRLIILLTIRAVCIAPSLELTYLNEVNNATYNLVFDITQIIEKLDNLNFISELNNVEKVYSGVKVMYGIPDRLFYKTNEESLFSTIKRIEINGNDITDKKKDIIDHLPAAIYKDARSHVRMVKDRISQIALLSVKTTDKEDKDLKITPDIFNNSTLDFLKLCFKRDLASLYELEYFLTTKINLSWQTLATSTFAELMIYVGMFNEEKKRQHDAERQQNRSPLGS